MTCKDCIHRELCADYVSSLAKVQNADVKYISQWLDEIEGKKNQTDNECEHFADRSRFVELPFDVGDSYFEILATIDDKTAAIFEFHIDRIIQLKNAYGEPTEIFYEDRKAGRFQNALKPYNRRFRSREEAEQALKESEENAN